MSIFVSPELVSKISEILELKETIIDLNNLLEFITFNGIYEPDFNWDTIPELWSEWLEK